MVQARLFEAVALAYGIEPDEVPDPQTMSPDWRRPLPDEYSNWLAIAVNQVNGGRLAAVSRTAGYTEHYIIDLAAFADWAERVPRWPLPLEFPRGERSAPAAAPWPWGTYETP